MTSDVSFENERHERSWLTTDRHEYLQGQAQALVAAEGDTHRRRDRADRCANRTKKSEVVEAVMALPVKYKEVVWLHYYEGYQTDEIAAMPAPAAVDRAESTARRPRKTES